MKKLLNLGEPYIRCYNHHAFPTGILSCSQSNKNWLYNNYLQLEYDPNCHRNIDHVSDYFLEKEKAFIKGYYMIPGDIKKRGEIISFYTNLIEMGSYIVGVYDEYFINKKRPYKKRHFIHNYILYGYDDEEKQFYSAGYIGEDMTWEPYTIDYESFTESLVVDNGYITFNNFIPAKSYFPLINLDKIIKGIHDFKNSECELQREGCVYGINGLKQYFKSINSFIDLGKKLHIPSIYCIMEHTKLLYERCMWLNENNYIFITSDVLSQLNDVVENYYKLLNMYIKYNISLNDLMGKRIVDFGLKCVDMEDNVLKRIIDGIMR